MFFPCSIYVFTTLLWLQYEKNHYILLILHTTYYKSVVGKIRRPKITIFLMCPSQSCDEFTTNSSGSPHISGYSIKVHNSSYVSNFWWPVLNRESTMHKFKSSKIIWRAVKCYLICQLDYDFHVSSLGNIIFLQKYFPDTFVDWLLQCCASLVPIFYYQIHFRLISNEYF